MNKGFDQRDIPEAARYGVLVVAIEPNSPAAFTGIQPGDIIVGDNKRKVEGVDSLLAALKRDSDSMLLQIDRNGILDRSTRYLRPA